MSRGFYERQLKMLADPLDPGRIQKREQDGKTFLYIEGWYALAEANAIFGYDGWDRQTLSLEKLFERKMFDAMLCAYSARVRITVMARARTIVREGTGFGQATAAHPAEAHERAMKGAETDATKRALATFGGRFGLLLYDKDQQPVAKRSTDHARAGRTKGQAGPNGHDPSRVEGAPHPAFAEDGASTPSRQRHRDGNLDGEGEQRAEAMPEADRPEVRPTDDQIHARDIAGNKDGPAQDSGEGHLDAHVQRPSGSRDRVSAIGKQEPARARATAGAAEGAELAMGAQETPNLPNRTGVNGKVCHPIEQLGTQSRARESGKGFEQARNAELIAANIAPGGANSANAPVPPMGTYNGTGAFVLATADGERWPVASAEAYCTGLRQLIGATSSSEALEALRKANHEGLAKLRAMANLKTARGEHFADVIERLIKMRAKALNAAKPRGPANNGVGSDIASKNGADMGNSTSPDYGAGANSCSLHPNTQAPSPSLGSVTHNATTPGSAPPKADHAPTNDPAISSSQQQRSLEGSEMERDQANPHALAQSSLTTASEDGDPAIARQVLNQALPPYPLKAMAERILGITEGQNATSCVECPAPSQSYSSAQTPEFGPTCKTDRIAEEPGSSDRVPSLSTPKQDRPLRRSRISQGHTIDKSALAIPSERRVRSKAHLARVAAEPCLICETTPCHAHHITYAQPRGLSLKVSDEYTVPLCAIHHNELHRSGNEASWWRSKAINPLFEARRLWLITADLAETRDEGDCTSNAKP